MKMIVALGNPENKFKGTKHNIAKEFLNIYKTINFKNVNWKNSTKTNSEVLITDNLILAKLGGYMNESGFYLEKLINYYKIEIDNLLIIYDELDLQIGEFKIAKNKNSHIHKGVISIKNFLNNQFDFWSLRIGIREIEIKSTSIKKEGRDPSEYVLSKFKKSDQTKLEILAKTQVNLSINAWLSK